MNKHLLRKFRQVATTALIFAFSGCASMSKFASYRPPGVNHNYGINVTSEPHIPPVFTLAINDTEVITLHWPYPHYHAAAEGNYDGKPIRMIGRFQPGGLYIIEVYISNEKAAQFNFP